MSKRRAPSSDARMSKRRGPNQSEQERQITELKHSVRNGIDNANADLRNSPSGAAHTLFVYQWMEKKLWSFFEMTCSIRDIVSTTQKGATPNTYCNSYCLGNLLNTVRKYLHLNRGLKGAPPNDGAAKNFYADTCSNLLRLIYHFYQHHKPIEQGVSSGPCLGLIVELYSLVYNFASSNFCLWDHPTPAHHQAIRDQAQEVIQDMKCVLR